jgi:hypothetical protein
MIRRSFGLPLVAVVIACSGPLPAASPTAVSRDRSAVGDFVLEISSPHTVWPAGEPIQVTAALAYVGPLAEQSLRGSGSGPIFFSVEELSGTRRMLASWTDDCAQHLIRAGQPINVPYAKSGGWSEDDPHAAFYRAFFGERAFRLPAGRWRITAISRFDAGVTCTANPLELSASIELEVR